MSTIWVVISGTCYESAEAIEGVYDTEEKAKLKESTLPNCRTYYSYIEEHEVE